MGRPRTEPADRRSTQIRFPTPMLDELHIAAAERDVSVNWLVNRAVADFLDRLIPVDEWKITR